MAINHVILLEVGARTSPAQSYLCCEAAFGASRPTSQPPHSACIKSSWAAGGVRDPHLPSSQPRQQEKCSRSLEVSPHCNEVKRVHGVSTIPLHLCYDDLLFPNT
ncbi:hypothetical protein PGT21_027001 [Puccinia graminis f. sp. tritici]|uniref:Uncharacterized protein n=1 Tax=Puccinia graminis f. sp. tritici TaxID=56615 RepID=A0A5B0MGR2_PUCGR|nr:hypothetical protein PGT21_027001 [Puccinia graminis f. sp. tritici]